MKLVLYSPPAVEPISLSELKLHLRHDSGSFSDQIDETQSIAPGSHGISAGGLFTHVGASLSVLGYNALVMFQSGTNGATGTVDVKIQDSDDNATWVDWTGGTFTTVNTGNDNATYEKAYTGNKAYIRTVSKVLLAACEFGTTIVRLAATSVEDDLLNDIITTAREHVEEITRRSLITQTWDMTLDRFPGKNYIEIPFGNLQNGVGTAPVITYKDTDGTVTTMTVTTDYLVETNGDQHGRIVLPYGGSWPSDTLYPSNPINIRFVCGYGDAGTDVPKKLKTAIKMLCADLWSNRESQVIQQSTVTYQENKTVERLLSSSRLWGEF